MTDNNENIILNKIYNTSNDLLNVFNKLKILKQEIKQDVNILNNNYFVEKTDSYEKFDELIDDEGIKQLTFLLDKLCKEVKEDLDTKCSEHEFIDDSADIGFDQSINICYCRHCHLSKKV